MANEYLNILVKVNKDTGELEVVKQQLTNLDGATKEASKSTNELGSAFSILKNLLPILSIGALVQQIKSSITEGEKELEVLRKLEFALKTNNIYTKDNINNLIQQSKYIQDVSRISDDQYLSSITRAVNMTGDLNTAIRLTNASMGVAQKTDIDMGQALLYLTWAANGNERGLSMLARSGLSSYIDKTKSAKENAEKLTSIFETLYKDTNTMTGNATQLKNYFNDVKEAIGQLLIPRITEGLKNIKSDLHDLGKIPIMENINEASQRVLVIQQNKAKAQDLLTKKEQYYNENKQYWDAKTLKTETDNLIILKARIKEMNFEEKAAQDERKTQREILQLYDEKYIKQELGLNQSINNAPLKTKAEIDAETQKQKALEDLAINYNIKIAQLDNDKILVKQLSDRQEIDSERTKLYELVTGNKTASKQIVDNWIKENRRQLKEITLIDKQEEKQRQLINRQVVSDKLESAQQMFSITKDFIDAGLTLAGEEFKKRKDWAIAMIVLEKSIAIMAAIRSAIEYSGAHPALAIASAAGSIALITAQAVQQINAISKASSNSSSTSGISSAGESQNSLSNEMSGSKISGQSFSTKNIGSGSESGSKNIHIHFDTIDPTNLTTDAQEKIARWLKNVLADENNR